MTDKLPKEVKRWTAKLRQALALQLFRGKTTPAEAARKYGLDVGIVGRCFVRLTGGLKVGIDPVAI